MSRKHIVRSYDEELATLKSKILEMGKQCDNQLTKAVKALNTRNSSLAEEIISSDVEIDALQSEIEALTVSMLARRQPMAMDLRNIVSALKMAAGLERIADYAKNIARHVIDLNNMALNEPVEIIVDMIETACKMIDDVLDGYLQMDAEKVIEVWHRDEQINQKYADLLGQLHSLMAKDAENIKAGTVLLFVGRCCERIGDHVKNLAENIHFIINGVTYRGKAMNASC